MVELRQPQASRVERRWRSWALFGILALGEALLGYYLNVVRDDIQNDALSRVASAFYVLFSRMPHLGAIGFVWTPLPSVLELGVVALWPLAPIVVTRALAGTALTAVASSLQTLTFLRASLKALPAPRWAWLLGTLWVLNPFLVLYGANGMSECLCSLFLVWATVGYYDWVATDSVAALVRTGVSLAFAFWVRYEAVVFGAALVVVAVVDAWIKTARWAPHRADRPPSFRTRLSTSLATACVVGLPLLYSGLVWLALNAIIMHDPLYFWHSNYSNAAQTVDLRSNPEFAALLGNPLRTIEFMLPRLAVFSGPTLALLAYQGIRRQLGSWDTWRMLVIGASIPGLQLWLLMHGASYGWLRFFFYPLPVGCAAALATWRHESRVPCQHRQVAAALLAVGLVVSGVASGWAMTNPNLAPEEYDVIHQTWNLERIRTTQAIAAYLNRHAAHGLVLMDSFSAFDVVVNLRNPKRAVIPSDFDFVAALRKPWRHDVRYVLVPEPVGVFRLDAVNQAYPKLYAQGARWASLVRQFSGWRLYEVHRPIPLHWMVRTPMPRGTETSIRGIPSSHRQAAVT